MHKKLHPHKMLSIDDILKKNGIHRELWHVPAGGRRLGPQSTEPRHPDVATPALTFSQQNLYEL
jgi:hypothetical protein